MDHSPLLQQAMTERLVTCVPPVSSTTSGQEVLKLFIENYNLQSLPVVDEQNVPIGIVDRHSLMELLIKPDIRCLIYEQPIVELMDADPIVVDIQNHVGDWFGSIFDTGMRYMVNRFLVTLNGRYVGMGSRKQTHLYYLAHFDQLTGLPNRLLFEDRLKLACLNASKTEGLVAVLIANLDRFKFVNDTYGYASGNLLLLDVSERIVSCVQKCDTVARLNGNEFAVILENIQDIDEAVSIGGKIVSVLGKPYQVFNDPLRISASVGVSIFPFHGSTEESLIAKADLAMSKAKKDYRGRCVVYSGELEVGLQERLAIESGLRSALENHEFSLCYQPQCEAPSGEVIGVEVLLRWNHPQMGMVPPSNFIPIAEETGMIIPIGEWVLREACSQHVAWQRQGLPPLLVAVNISAVQFRQPDFEQTVQEVLKETGMEPRFLELELTEGVVMGDIDRTLDALAQLRKLGVKLAIDDFGTGYSSLSYLKELSLDRLKIDRSFIRDIDKTPINLAIVRTIVSLGKNLGIKLIAEGVETDSELNTMVENDCLEIQGYRISKPVSADTFSEWFRNKLAGQNI